MTDNPFRPPVNGRAAQDIRIGDVVKLSGRSPRTVSGIVITYYPGTNQMNAVTITFEGGHRCVADPGYVFELVEEMKPPALIPERTVSDYLARFLPREGFDDAINLSSVVE